MKERNVLQAWQCDRPRRLAAQHAGMRVGRAVGYGTLALFGTRVVECCGQCGWRCSPPSQSPTSTPLAQPCGSPAQHARSCAL